MHLALSDMEDSPVLAERVKPPRAIGESTAILMGLVGVAWRLVKSSGHGLYFPPVERKSLHPVVFT